MQNTFKDFIQRNWPLRFLALLVFQPRRLREEFLRAFVDYRRFRRTVERFRAFIAGVSGNPARPGRTALLIVAGRSMEAQWCQLWAVLGSVYRSRGHKVFVLLSRAHPIQYLYFRLFGIERIVLEDLRIAAEPVPERLASAVAGLDTFQRAKDFVLDGMPIGQIAISTYGRLRATGIVDLNDPEVRAGVHGWILYLHQTLAAAKRLYIRHDIGMLFFTEVFMLEYGAFYYGALAQHLNVIRFAATVRDEAIVVQHLNDESDRTHHAAVADVNWARIREYPESAVADRELHQNFLDRYGDRWALSSRNQPNTRIMLPQEARALLNAPEDRKIAVVFSHILYDTMFFFGEDLFPCYADWFLATVKAACRNPNLTWFVKVHPSNLWRGELQHYFGGKYEELRLIEQHIGALPEHVRLVYPDTPISPYTWFQLADYGITVRGTSGIELAALGKSVLTAGSGRYEKIGFTINSRSAEEYLARLERLPDIPDLTAEQRRLARRFAYATFCMKPFTLDFFKPVARAGKKIIFSSYDLVYLGNFPAPVRAVPHSIERFVRWSFDRESVDFMNEWPGQLEIPQGARRTA